MTSACITTSGLVTSLGLDARHACSALRAGLVRRSPLTGAAAADPEGEPMAGCPVPFVTAGFGPLGRWVQLVRYAFDDLARQWRVRPDWNARTWSRTAIALVLPQLRSDRFESLAPGGLEAGTVLASVLPTVLRARHLPPPSVHGAFFGASGVPAALAQAREWLHAGRADHVLVAVADSMLDADSLAWLARDERLAVQSPTGVVPGEAGACLLLEREGTGVHIGEPVAHLDPTEDPIEAGRHLGRALRRAVAAPASVDVYVSDLTGETWSAKAHGTARSLASDREHASTVFEAYAPSIGYVGAASSAVGLAQILHEARRGRAPHRGLVATAAIGEGVGAIPFSTLPR